MIIGRMDYTKRKKRRGEELRYVLIKFYCFILTNVTIFSVIKRLKEQHR